jgi:hypothetical protein
MLFPSAKTFMSGLEAIKTISESIFSLSITILIPILFIEIFMLSGLNIFLNSIVQQQKQINELKTENSQMKTQMQELCLKDSSYSWC